MVRREVSIPVMATGRIVTPGEGERLIAGGNADLVAMTRAILADPDLPRKAKGGRTADIRYCTGCNEGCIGRNYEGQSVICIQNPVIGRERELGALVPTATPGTVAVIGGGVAGMEAARVAALRGHRVILFEKSDQLGGQVLLAARAPKRGEYIGNARWLEHQLHALPTVELRMGQEADVDTIVALQAATVIVATGASPCSPSKPGIDRPTVVHAETVFERVAGDTASLHSIHPALHQGAHIVVIDEEGYAKGVGVADLLATLGCDVDFVTSQYMPAQQLPDMPRVPILRSLYAHEVRFHPNLLLESVEGESVHYKQFFADHRVVIEGVDLVVLAYQPRADDTLARQLKGLVADLRCIGDCVAPRSIASAILEGTLVGRSV
jgi:NADPH-dependent 2,4-dienoyl-CoA reductase/sulfur reductase-like enzyme